MSILSPSEQRRIDDNRLADERRRADKRLADERFYAEKRAADDRFHADQAAMAAQNPGPIPTSVLIANSIRDTTISIVSGAVLVKGTIKADEVVAKVTATEVAGIEPPKAEKLAENFTVAKNVARKITGVFGPSFSGIGAMAAMPHLGTSPAYLGVRG